MLRQEFHEVQGIASANASALDLHAQCTDISPKAHQGSPLNDRMKPGCWQGRNALHSGVCSPAPVYVGVDAAMLVSAFAIGMVMGWLSGRIEPARPLASLLSVIFVTGGLGALWHIIPGSGAAALAGALSGLSLHGLIRLVLKKRMPTYEQPS